jgi:cytochrome c peroxidase
MGRLGGRGLPAKDLADLELFMTRYMDAGAPSHAPTTLAQRGKQLFESDDVGCAHCHAPGSRFTDGRNHDVGTTTAEEISRTLAE